MMKRRLLPAGVLLENKIVRGIIRWRHGAGIFDKINYIFQAF